MPEVLEPRLIEYTASQRVYAINQWRATIILLHRRQWSWRCWRATDNTIHGRGKAPTLDMAKRMSLAMLSQLAKEV